MPKLNNPRWEKFAKCTATGMKRPDAYEAAGYKASNRKAASKRGVNLYSKPQIKGRVAELEEDLREDTLSQAEIDRSYVLTNLKQNSERAQQAVPMVDRSGNTTGEFKLDTSASNRALELMGKEVGMFQDRFDTEGLDAKIKDMTTLEVRAAIRAAATDVGLRMVEMDDEQLRTFILINAPRVGLRCVEEIPADPGSGEASEDRGVPAIPEAGGIPPIRH